MADFCSQYDKMLYECSPSPGRWVLCEGHGRFEKLDGDGRPVEVLPLNTQNPPIRMYTALPDEEE